MMMKDGIALELDHLAVAGETRAAAQAYIEDALGVTMQPGGAHDVFFTHNALLGLEDGLYLEAIAIDPEAPAPKRPRWFDLDRFSGPARLSNWICRSADLEAVLAHLPEGMGTLVDLARDRLRWRMAVPQTGILPFDNCAPALIQWQAGGHPCDVLRPSGVRLRSLTVMHPRASELAVWFQGILTDPRLRYEQGDAGLIAEFDTPHGTKVLTG